MASYRFGRMIGVFIAALVSSQQAGCMEHKVGGKAVDEVFTEPRLAELARSACKGDVHAIEGAVKAGANPNGKGFEDVTPLYWAVSCENLSGIEALLRAGADPNYMFGGDFSVVYAAARMKDPAVLKLLLKFGGDPNAKNDKRNHTALAAALSVGMHSGNWANYYALLDAGADINRADDRGWTIASEAAAFNQYEKVAELLERGYNHDLPELGRVVQTGYTPTLLPEAAKWKAKVKTMLEQRGVHFPVPPKATP